MRESVSTVIPTHNYGHFVTEAVDSVLAQTWPSLEIIVVDDGSQDDTRQRLARYGDRIRCIPQEQRGVSAARNTGIRAAAGDWIALLDADDRWHPEKTEIQLEAAARVGRFDVVGSPGYSGAALDHLPRNPVVRRLAVADCLGNPPINCSTTLVRRRCFQEIGYFDETLRGAEDRDMWLRLVSRYPTAQVLTPCWMSRTHTGQASRNAQQMYADHRRALKRFFREHPQPISIERYGLAFMYLTNSITYLEEGNRRKAIELLLYSLRTWPLPLRTDPAWGPGFRLRLLARAGLGDARFHRVSSTLRRLGETAGQAK